MLKDNDRLYLLESLKNNRCVLFIGAGFSTDALNKFDAPIPDAEGLATILWEWQGLSGGYDDSPLGEVYESALHSGRPLASLREVLESHLLAVKLAPWYHLVPKFFWMRLYGTNVDNVIELAFARASAGQKLDVVVAQRNDIRDRDQFLGSIQYIKLNGSLPGDPAAITFATRQYARRSAEYDRWYDCFVRDYVFQPTVFVGTELREPLFWQAIESRQKRGDNPEERPRSFLVTPTISPAKEPILDSLNIVHVPASGQQFFNWLQVVYDFPTRAQVLQLVAPEAVELFADVGLQQEYREALAGC